MARSLLLMAQDTWDEARNQDLRLHHNHPAWSFMPRGYKIHRCSWKKSELARDSYAQIRDVEPERAASSLVKSSQGFVALQLQNHISFPFCMCLPSSAVRWSLLGLCRRANLTAGLFSVPLSPSFQELVSVKLWKPQAGRFVPQPLPLQSALHNK